MYWSHYDETENRKAKLEEKKAAGLAEAHRRHEIKSRAKAWRVPYLAFLSLISAGVKPVGAFRDLRAAQARRRYEAMLMGIKVQEETIRFVAILNAAKWLRSRKGAVNRALVEVLAAVQESKRLRLGRREDSCRRRAAEALASRRRELKKARVAFFEAAGIDGLELRKGIQQRTAQRGEVEREKAIVKAILLLRRLEEGEAAVEKEAEMFETEGRWDSQGAERRGNKSHNKTWRHDCGRRGQRRGAKGKTLRDHRA